MDIFPFRQIFYVSTLTDPDSAHVLERLVIPLSRLRVHPTYQAMIASDSSSYYLDRQLARLFHCPMDQTLREVLGPITAFVAVSTKPIVNIPVEIRSLTGKSYPMLMVPSDTIAQCKQEIFRIDGIPVDQQRFVIDRNIIGDHVAVGTVLPSDGHGVIRMTLILRLRGGCGDTMALVRASSCTLHRRHGLPAVRLKGLWPPPNSHAAEHNFTLDSWSYVERWVESGEAALSVELVPNIALVHAVATAFPDLHGQLWSADTFWPMLMTLRRVAPHLSVETEQRIASYLTTPPAQCLRGRPIAGATTIKWLGSVQDRNAAVELAFTLQGGEHRALAALCADGRNLHLRFSLNLSSIGRGPFGGTFSHGAHCVAHCLHRDHVWHTVCTAVQTTCTVPPAFNGGGFSFWNN
jgi:hypothetical protein